MTFTPQPNKEITLKLRARTVRILIAAAQKADPSGLFFSDEINNITRQLEEQLTASSNEEDGKFILP